MARFSFANDFGTFKQGDNVVAFCLDGAQKVTYQGEITDLSGSYVEINRSVYVHYQKIHKL